MGVPYLQSSPFDLTNGLRDLFPGDEGRLLLVTGQMMTFNNSAMTDDFMASIGLSKATTRLVFGAIVSKTLRFTKPYECLTAGFFVEGGEGARGARGVSTRTISTHLRKLREAGLIHTFKRQGREWFYALNLEPVIAFLRNRFSVSAPESMDSDERIFRGLWSKLQPLLTSLGSVLGKVRSFAGAVFYDYKTFASEAKAKALQAVAVAEVVAEVVIEKAHAVTVKAKEVVMNLADALKSVAKGSKVVADKQRKRAALPLFDAKGKPLSHNGIALWDSLVADFEYLGYSPRHTGKVFGNMKCWLAELAKQGFSEDEIRERMSDMVRRWRHMSRNASVLAISKNNKPYRTPIDRTPHFASFFACRDQYSVLLVAANVPTVSLSSKEKENVDFNRHNIF